MILSFLILCLSASSILGGAAKAFHRNGNASEKELLTKGPLHEGLTSSCSGPADCGS